MTVVIFDYKLSCNLFYINQEIIIFKVSRFVTYTEEHILRQTVLLDDSVLDFEKKY